MSKVSIISPVYGVEKYIGQFLESIRHQTFQDFEVILVDDGSKDNCPQILDDFAKEDERYNVIQQSNSGVSVARNTGIKRATGDYVYIVDSDDWLEPTAIGDLWNEALKTIADLIYGDYIAESTSGSVTRHCFKSGFFTSDIKTISALQFAVNANTKSLKISRPEFDGINAFGGAPWRCMIKTNIIKDNAIYYDPYVKGLGDDILFMLHVYEHVQSVSYIQKIIYHYRKLDDSYSHGYKAINLETISRILEKQEKFLEEYHKGDLLWQSYYMRIFLYLQEGMQRYFKNENNPKTKKELFHEFKYLMKIEPYCDVSKNMPTKYMVGGVKEKNWKYFFLVLAYTEYTGEFKNSFSSDQKISIYLKFLNVHLQGVFFYDSR